MKITNHGGAWTAEIEILDGPMSALKLAIGIFCRDRQRARKSFTLGRALASEKYPEGLGEVEAWLEGVAGSAELKHKVLAAVALAVVRIEVPTYDWYLFAELIGQEKPFGREFEEGYRVQEPQRLRSKIQVWAGSGKFADLKAAIDYAQEQVEDQSLNLDTLEIIHEDEWGNKTPMALVKRAGILCLHRDLHYDTKGVNFDLETIERWAVQHWDLENSEPPYEVHLEDLEDLKEYAWRYSRTTSHWKMRVAPTFGWDENYDPKKEKGEKL